MLIFPPRMPTTSSSPQASGSSGVYPTLPCTHLVTAGEWLEWLSEAYPTLPERSALLAIVDSHLSMAQIKAHAVWMERTHGARPRTPPQRHRNHARK